MAQRAWMFTLANPEGHIDFDVPGVRELVRYAIYQEEVSNDTGLHHFQGYMELREPVRFTAVKKLPGFETCHFEKRMGTRDQAKAYCSKEDTKVDGPWEYGTWEAGGQGRQPVLLDIQHEIKEGATERQIADKYFEYYIRYHQGIKRYIMMHNGPTCFKSPFKLEDFNVDPIPLDLPVFLQGYSKTGKTQFALAHFENPLLIRELEDLSKLDSSYDGLVFDDMSFRHMPPNKSIHLTDWDLPSSMRVLYGIAVIPAKMRRIFVSNQTDIFFPDPEKYKNVNDETLNAIRRRYVYCELPNRLLFKPSAMDRLKLMNMRPTHQIVWKADAPIIPPTEDEPIIPPIEINNNNNNMNTD